MLDEQQGRQYDNIVYFRAKPIVFDSPYKYHYLAAKSDGVYLVEEKIE